MTESIEYWKAILILTSVLGVIFTMQRLEFFRSHFESASHNIIGMIRDTFGLSLEESTIESLTGQGRGILNHTAKIAIKDNLLKHIFRSFVFMTGAIILNFLLIKGVTFYFLWLAACLATSYFIYAMVIAVYGLTLFRPCDEKHLRQFYEDHGKDGTLTLAAYLDAKSDDCQIVDVCFITDLMKHRKFNKQKGCGRNRLEDSCRTLQEKVF